jgi:4-hydroxythreonine-4-phosphate dehydrogenase
MAMDNRDLAVAVVADDLSGGADCGVSFAHAGLDVAIQLDRHAAPPGWAQAAVIPTDSRDAGAEESRAAVTEAVAALASRHPALWYKKIDSTLRGHLALELAAAIHGVRPDLTIVAPAFPAHGRTVTGGRGFLNGTPLESAEVWQASGRTGPAHLPDLLRAPGGRAGGLRVRSLGLDDIRAGRAGEFLAGAASTGAVGSAAGNAAGTASVVVCDAEADDDLAAIVAGGLAAGGLAAGRRILWVGSAGLAQHLAGLHAGGRAGVSPPGLPAGEGDKPVAVVVGSAAGAAAGQLGYLESRPGIRVVRVHPATILPGAPAGGGSTGAAHDLAAAGRALGEALASGQDVALGFVPPGAPGGLLLDTAASRVLSRALGELVARYNDQIGGIVATGGDTARAVLGACGITALRPVGEVVTGVPVSIASPDGRPVVTKAGAFGDDQVLARAVDVLHGRGGISAERNSFHVFR